VAFITVNGKACEYGEMASQSLLGFFAPAWA